MIKTIKLKKKKVVATRFSLQLRIKKTLVVKLAKEAERQNLSRNQLIEKALNIFVGIGK